MLDMWTQLTGVTADQQTGTTKTRYKDDMMLILHDLLVTYSQLPQEYYYLKQQENVT